MLPQRRPKSASRAYVSRECPAHRNWVRGFACSFCGHMGTERNPIEAAHVRLGTNGGTSLKPSDKWCVSLCADCHARQHKVGERTFWKPLGINPKILAEEFARKSPHWLKLKEMP